MAVKRIKRGMRKVGVRRRPMRRGRTTKAGEYASAKQTIALAPDLTNVLYRFDDINLGLFDRLSSIARNYQYFRFSKIQVKFTPYADTFQQNNQNAIPYLFYMINKSDSLDCSSFNQIRDMGAKPIRFDEKTITVSWKPAVSNLTIGAQPPVGPPVTTAWATYRTSPWLSTDENPSDQSIAWNPSAVPHKGMFYGVEQANAQGSLQYAMEVTVYAQFKKPLSPFFNQEAPAQSTKKEIKAKTDFTTVPPA